MSGTTDRPLLKLLLVEDDEAVRSQMRWALAEDYEIFQAGDRSEAVELMRREHPPLVCLDLGLPPDAGGVSEGFQALDELLQEDSHAKIIVITGQGDRSNALRAVARGAYDFFSKPIEIETLQVVLARAGYLYRLEEENRRLRGESGGGFEGMLGTSPQMEEVFATIRKVAPTDAPVLIVGESGTGKELAARAIHRRSRRGEGPFIPINCGAIPENLLESELFGHEKGAFTGADRTRPGQVESAQGGTLFLDEIGELPPQLQVKLLRFLQDGQIQRVGGRNFISVDARIIAATNADLDELLRAGKFREDLYYRLAVVVIHMPPLRDRGEDIPLLAQSFLERYAREAGRAVSGFAADAQRAIKEYLWPGNVRELENRVRRAVILSEGKRVRLKDLGLDKTYARYTAMTLREARETLERELVEAALQRHDGNISRAAEDLGISRPTLYELMDKLGLREKERG
ncbi:MAG: PEP-CTERM-box response regulator transcription factor [Acidobacteriota bacterium]